MPCATPNHPLSFLAANPVTNLSDAVKAVPSDVLVLGNYSPTDLLLENPDQVRLNVCKMLHPVANAVNVVASTGCDIPAAAPPENIEAFVNTAKSFARKVSTTNA